VSGAGRTPWDAIVLDLDDTLFDTTGVLLPAADLRAVETLLRHGLPIGTDAALGRVASLRRAGVSEVLASLAAEHGLSPGAVRAAEDAFFRYEVPPIRLDDDVAAALDALRGIAPLALLTYGNEATQRAKAERLGLPARFATLDFVGASTPGGKTGALAAILSRQGWRPDRVVFAGDRLDGDVRAANRCGCRAVWVRREGTEFSALRPQGPEDTPWRTIEHVRELPGLLRGV
jgi:putative hydrolase of the HAD superfamily